MTWAIGAVLYLVAGVVVADLVILSDPGEASAAEWAGIVVLWPLYLLAAIAGGVLAAVAQAVGNWRARRPH